MNKTQNGITISEMDMNRTIYLDDESTLLTLLNYMEYFGYPYDTMHNTMTNGGEVAQYLKECFKFTPSRTGMAWWTKTNRITQLFRHTVSLDRLDDNPIEHMKDVQTVDFLFEDENEGLNDLERAYFLYVLIYAVYGSQV